MIIYNNITFEKVLSTLPDFQNYKYHVGTGFTGLEEYNRIGESIVTSKEEIEYLKENYPDFYNQFSFMEDDFNKECTTIELQWN